MSTLWIEGGVPLHGTVTVHGAKNSVLPLLAAVLLTDGICRMTHCPALSDVDTAVAILRELGCVVERDGDGLTIDPRPACRTEIPAALMGKMRGSILFLGALAGRFGRATLALPGGCPLGNRPIDLHLAALGKLGLTIREECGTLTGRAEGPLRGCPVLLALPSVGATENTLLGAVTAIGTTTIFNAAREPEIEELCRFLNARGAEISGIGSSTLTIHGVARLSGGSWAVMPDRMEAATFLAAAAVTGGSLRLKRVCPEHLSAVLPVFTEMGCTVRCSPSEITLDAPDRLLPVKTVRTAPYPGFPTDAQAPVMAMAAVADGKSILVENLFDGRFAHVPALREMGAQIAVQERVAVVHGVPKLHGAAVACTDLRGGAALLIAGLAANGVTVLSELSHLRRGYEDPEGQLTALGAHIVRKG